MSSRSPGPPGGDPGPCPPQEEPRSLMPPCDPWLGRQHAGSSPASSGPRVRKCRARGRSPAPVPAHTAGHGARPGVPHSWPHRPLSPPGMAAAAGFSAPATGQPPAEPQPLRRGSWWELIASPPARTPRALEWGEPLLHGPDPVPELMSSWVRDARLDARSPPDPRPVLLVCRGLRPCPESSVWVSPTLSTQ